MTGLAPKNKYIGKGKTSKNQTEPPAKGAERQSSVEIPATAWKEKCVYHKTWWLAAVKKPVTWTALLSVVLQLAWGRLAEHDWRALHKQGKNEDGAGGWRDGQAR